MGEGFFDFPTMFSRVLPCSKNASPVESCIWSGETRSVSAGRRIFVDEKMWQQMSLLGWMTRPERHLCSHPLHPDDAAKSLGRRRSSLIRESQERSLF